MPKGGKSTRVALDNTEPLCPSYLTGDGRAIWDSIVESLRKVGLLDSSLGPHIGAYVAASLEIEDCERILAAEGITQYVGEGATGRKMMHPCVGIRNAAVQRMGRLGAQLGITTFERGRANRKPAAGIDTSRDETGKPGLAVKLYEDANKKRKKATG